MIEINKLTESDKGRNVSYRSSHGLLEYGKLTSWNDTFVFVQFKGPTGEACKPSDVSFDFDVVGTPISELSGRPGHPGYDRFSQIASSWGYD